MPARLSVGPVAPGQVVAGQLAVVALVLAALDHRAVGWLLAVPVAATLTAAGFLRWRHRWAYAWLTSGLRYLGRPANLPPGADPAALLAFVEPTAAFVGPVHGSPAGPGVIEDADGIVAVIELGEPAALLSGSGPPIPAPADLLPPDRNVTVQLVVGAVPAAGTGLAGASYRQLTDGLVPARQRALLAVRVSPTDPHASADDLRGTLAGEIGRAHV